MQHEYKIIIRNERYRYVKNFQVVFLFVIAIVFSIACYFENNMYNFLWIALITFSLFIAINQQDFQRYRFLRSADFLKLGFLWAVCGAYFLLPGWITLLIAIISILQFFVKDQYEISINEKLVFIKTFPQKNVEWQSLQNLILKDDLLTIDYSNNKIFQAEIVPQLSNIGNETEFNDFCRLQLKLHK